MNKKMIIIIAGLSLVGFGASFLVSFILGKKTSPTAQNQPAQQAVGQEQVNAQTAEQNTAGKNEKTLKSKLEEHQLQGLIHDVREKIREYDKKTGQIKENEDRLRLTQKSIQKDIDSLNKLRIEIASLTAQLKQQRQQLLDTRIEIQQNEQENLQKIASTYDTMKPQGAASIFTNMSKLNTSQSQGMNDVVKILYYMEDRNKANVLAELVKTEPKLAAVLSQELKKVKEITQ